MRFGARTEYNTIHGSSPIMAEFHSTHDIFCKLRPEEVFQVSVEWY